LTNIDKVGIGANTASLRDLEKEKRYTFIKGDICDSKVLDRVIKHVDLIVNMAAETHVDRSIANPGTFMQSNTVGTFTILEAIRKHNKQAKLIQVSTDEVYGEVPEGSFDEREALKPSNPYSASKASADIFIQAYYKTYDLDISITRCTNNFGPYQFPEKFIPKTIIRALKKLPIPIYGTGKNIRDWIYVLDHCEALDLVLKRGKQGETYNISSGNEMPNIVIVRKILQLLGRKEDLISFVEDRPGHDVRYSLDSSKIRTELGWKPRFTFNKAVETTVNWYQDNEAWWKPLATREALHPMPWKLREAK
jgi:dTDP-glucose 4,6-dehydratase